MSVVAIKIYKDRIELGSDSQVSSYYMYKDDVQKRYGIGKIVKENDVYLGGVGDLSEISLAKLFLKKTKPGGSREDDILEWLVSFYEYCRSKNGDFRPFNQWIMVFKDRAFLIYPDFSIFSISDYEAIGCGMSEAKPILAIGRDIREAIAMACKLDLYCNKPIKIYSIPKNRAKK